MIKNERSISIVVPVYGCRTCLDALCSRLENVLKEIADIYEIILVDDRSPDAAWFEILRLQRQYDCVKGVRLSKNFGQHIAITAGLSEAGGNLVAVMDCDLQDPPEVLPQMVAKLDEGCDLVLGRRTERNHSKFRVFAAALYFKLMGYLTEEKIDGSYGSFSLLTRKVVDEFLKFGEKERHYLFIIRWLGFEVASVEYTHNARLEGNSSYTLKSLLRHAFDGMFFQSTVFLRWIVASGLLFAIFGVFLAFYFIYMYFTLGSVEGWTSVVVLILICTGVILTSLGVMGLYIGKIFNQTKGRPLYVIDTVIESERMKSE